MDLLEEFHKEIISAFHRSIRLPEQTNNNRRENDKLDSEVTGELTTESARMPWLIEGEV